MNSLTFHGTPQAFRPAVIKGAEKDEEERFADINVPETRTVDDLFKVVSAETGVSLTSPMEMVINDVKFYRNDTRTLVAAGINEYDMVEVKVLKNGGRPIPGNVTVTDLYNALGERLKKMKIDSFSPMTIESVPEEPKKEEPEPVKVEAPKVEAPKAAAPAAPVKAPAATNAFAVKAPAATNAFAVKPKAATAFSIKTPAKVATPAPAVEEKPAAPAATNAFAIKAPAATNAFAVKPKAATAFAIKTPAKVATPAPAPVEEKPAAPVEEKPAAPAAPEEVKPAVTAPPAPAAKPQFAVKTNAFAVKSKFAIKKP